MKKVLIWITVLVCLSLILIVTDITGFVLFKPVSTFTPAIPGKILSTLGENTSNPYYAIWEHLTNPEKVIYNNNFTAFYQEMLRAEGMGVTKWYPSESAVVYGPGPDSKETYFHRMDIFNGSIYVLSRADTDRFINFDLNGTFVRQFGYRNTHYYSEGFTIDNDYIFIDGRGDGSMQNTLRRYYFINATPAPFFLNGQLTFETPCGLGECPQVYSDGKFLYQHDGQIRSRQNLQFIGKITYRGNYPEQRRFKIGNLRTENNSLYVLVQEWDWDMNPITFCNVDSDCYGMNENLTCVTHESGRCSKDKETLCEDDSRCMRLNLGNCTKSWCDKERQPTVPQICRYTLPQNEQSLFVLQEDFCFSVDNDTNMEMVDAVAFTSYNNELAYQSARREPLFPCLSNSDCDLGYECRINITGQGICERICTVDNDCTGICKEHDKGFCRGSLIFFECENNLDCPVSDCVKKWCGNGLGIEFYNLEGNFLKEVKTDFKINGVTLSQRMLFLDDKYFFFKDEESGFGVSYGAYIFLVSRENLSLVSTIGENAEPFKISPGRPKVLDNGLLFFKNIRTGGGGFKGMTDSNTRKPSGMLSENPGTTEIDLCSGSEGEGFGYHNTTIIFNQTKYRFNPVSSPGFVAPFGVNIYRVLPKQIELIKFIDFSTIYDADWPCAIAVDNSTNPLKMYVWHCYGPIKDGKQKGGIIEYSIDLTNNSEWKELGRIVQLTETPLPYFPYTSDEWWVIPTFGWYYNEIPYLDQPLKVAGKICLVHNEQGKTRLYVATERNGRIITFLSPKVLNPAQ